MFSRDYGIILACDVLTLDDLAELVRVGETSPVVVGYKVGFALGLGFGLPRVVDAVRKLSKLPIIYDHQKAGTDIPRMGQLFAQVCRRAGIDGIIVFPQAGPETLAGFVKGIDAAGATPIVGGVMTHPAYLKSEGGFIDDEAPAKTYQKAAELGVDHFVLPGNKAELIRKYASLVASLKEKASILMPGIGTQGGQVSEAFAAAAGHRCFAIVGSAVYDAKDKEKALADVAEQVLRYATAR